MKRQKTVKRLNPDELSLFFWQISLLLESGISLADGMESVLEGFQSSGHIDELNRLRAALEEKGSLSQAMEAVDLFPPYAHQMTLIGESAGRLEEISKSLSDYYQQESKILSAIKNAVSYPLALLVIIAVVIVVMLAGALPIFERVYAGFGAEVPAATQLWLNAGGLIGKIVLGIICAFFVLLLAMALAARGSRREQLLTWICRVLPPIRGVCERIAAWRFSTVYAMLMNVGYPSGEALEMTAGVLKTSRAMEAAESILQDIRENRTDSYASIEKCGLFDALSLKMLRMGFSVGHSDTVMQKISEIYREEVEERIFHYLSLIEPVLVGILAVIIGCIMLSVILPLIGILTSFM